MNTIVTEINLAVLWSLIAVKYYYPGKPNKLMSWVAGAMFITHLTAAIVKTIYKFLA